MVGVISVDGPSAMIGCKDIYENRKRNGDKDENERGTEKKIGEEYENKKRSWQSVGTEHENRKGR